LAGSEQAADEFGLLAEARSLGGSFCGEFGLDLLQYPRQRHSERNEGSVKIR
jgi:hypothetical protein